MSHKEKLAVIKLLANNYYRGNKKDKSELLTRLQTATGYHRKYLIAILKNASKKRSAIRRRRSSKYLSVLKSLRQLWAVSNYACGKRLIPVLPAYLESLERFGELKTNFKERKLLLSVSPATCDRLLKVDRKRINLKGRSGTKPGTLLKYQIPIKTWADWNNAKPGFLEIDSVHHCGFSLYGEYIFTLDTVDVCTGWNECAAHLGRSEHNTILALEKIKARLPFPLLGIVFDCGGEFVNYHLVRYAERNQITYTRARAAMKNDQAYIEQQNYSVVRRFVGYQRLDKPEQLIILNQLYEMLSDYQNFFQSVMRLKEKIRDGARVTRKYDQAKTAYRRILERDDIPEKTKQQLTERFLKLNPKKLILEITKLGRQLTEK